MDSYISSLTDPNVFTIVEIPVIQIQDELGLLGNESNVPICYVPVEETSGEQEPDPSSKCRICAVASHDLVSIFGEEGAQEHLESKIHRHLPIKVMREDTLPTGLCRECIEKLNVCHNLVNCSIETEKKLRALFEKSVNEESEGEDYIEESVPMHDGEPASIVGLPVAVVSGPESEATHCTDNKFSFVKCEEPDVTSESITGDIESRTDSLETKQEIHFEDETFGPSCGKYENVNVCSDVENVSKSQADTAKGGPGDETDDVESDHFEDGDRKNGDDSFSEPMETQDTEVSRCKTSGDNVVGHDSSIEQKQDGDDDEEPYTIIEGDFSYTFILLDNFKKGEEPKLELVMVRLPLSKEKKPISINPVKVAKCLKNFSASQTDGSIQLSYDEFVQMSITPVVHVKESHRRKTNHQVGENVDKIETADVPSQSYCNIALVGNYFANHTKTSGASDFDRPFCFKASKGFKLFEKYLKARVTTEINSIAKSSKRVRYLLRKKEVKLTSGAETKKLVKENKQASLHTRVSTLQLSDSDNEGKQLGSVRSKPYKCMYCKSEYTNSVNFNKHLGSHTKEKPFSCHMCSESFPSKLELKNHEENHSNEEEHPCIKLENPPIENLFFCDICHEFFERESYLENHKLQHQQNERCYCCEICGKKYTTSEGRNVHVQTHLGEKAYSCKLCNKSYSLKYTLKCHMETHNTTQRFLCELCGADFLTRTYLRYHVRGVHAKKFKYNCKICKEGFHALIELVQHKKSHSEEENAAVMRAQCDICGKYLSAASALRSHKKMHSDLKPYSCKFCEKKFRQLSQIREHERRHTGEKPYKCKYCEQAFVCTSELHDHESRKHTGIAYLKCRYCEQFFQHRNDLRKHYRNIHKTTQPKPTKCRYCDRMFKDRKYAAKHEKKHAEKLTFKCEICSKYFGSDRSLKLHSLVHTDLQMYSCPTCFESFRTVKELKLHSNSCGKSQIYICHKCELVFNSQIEYEEHEVNHAKRLVKL